MSKQTTMASENSLSRRSFVSGAAAGAAGIAMYGTAEALRKKAYADETEEDAETEDASEIDAEAESSEEETDIWGEEPSPVDSFDFVEEIDCDLVVVGAGTAGMPAAVSAAEEGLSVVVLEKMSTGFGMRNYVGAVGTTTQQEAGIEIDEKEIVQEMLRYSSYRAKASLIKLWAERSGEAIDWYTTLMEEGGMSVWLETDINDSDEMQFKEYSTCHMYYNLDDDELTETSIMSAKMEELGCDVRYSTPMVQLIQEDDGKVSGVVAQNADGEYIRVNASKGVALATGGYAADTDMMMELNSKDYLANVMVYCDSASTGDGIRAAHHAGGEMDLAHTAMYFQRGCTLPGSVGGDVSTPNMWWMGSQPFLQVNQKGERFCNESLPYDYNLHQAAAQAGRVFVSIFDSNWQEDVTAFHTIGCSRIVSSDDITQGYEAVQWTFDSIMAASFEPALEGGQLVQADTIEELAEKMGMDPDTLVATVDHYNELCEAGEDTDYYKESFRLRPVAEAPFYAVTVGGQLLCTMDGMQINENFNVLDSEGDPIEGLYALGNDSGSYFADCYPELIVGAAAGRSITFGYLLGKNLASE